MTALHRAASSLAILGPLVVSFAGAAEAQIGGFWGTPSVSNAYCSAFPSTCGLPTTLLESSRAALNTLCANDPANCLDRTPPPSENEIIALKGDLERNIDLLEWYESLDKKVQLGVELSRLCDVDPASCSRFIRELMREGVVDGDRDGVLDLTDECPGTPSPLARAQEILMSQDAALKEIGNILGQAIRLAGVSYNSTIGYYERRVIADQVDDLYSDLLAVANATSDGRYLFGGTLDEEPPFRVSGAFGPGSTPRISYLGDHGRLSLPVDRAGEEVAITIPGGSLFLGDLDGDGVYPDQGRMDLFAFLAEGYTALQSVGSTLDWILEFDSVDDPLYITKQENSELFARTKRVVAIREVAAVNAAGCSQEQFCASIQLERRRDWRVCEQSDFMNDEPLRRQPRDCRVRFSRKSGPDCVARDSEKREGRSVSRWRDVRSR